MQFDLASTDALLSTTRAVRKRLDLDKPVPRSVILECVALSQQAPTGSNAQGWRWVIVEDPAKRAALGEIYKQAGAGYLASGAEATKGQGQQGRVMTSALWLAENMGRAPVLAIPCIEGALPEGAPAAMVASQYASIYPAVWSFQLALRARGLGSTLTTLHLLKEKEAAEVLGLPDNVLQVAMLPVAYTVGTDFKRADRPGPETIVHWDGW
ncbi:MAG: nitroreductase family protein [Novosphingobium sp.]